ncbi:MAG TPA: hypothetical protein DD730_02420 [Desulfosporosinus sp.]|jgi:uncharacterized membrane protein|nr:hypothetical protein [Desulfosporosinus sp.]
MPQESYDLKRRASEQLKGQWLQAGIVCFIAWLLTLAFTGGNAVHSMQTVWQNGELMSVPNTTSSNGLGGLLSFILMGPVTLGVSGYFLKLIRKEGPIIEDMFKGFRFFIKTFVLHLLITVFTILWTLLLIIPGIIASFRYSMAYYIMMDNPELSAFEALSESKRMMIGFKFQLFLLNFSFLGWFLLGVVTLGIAFLWVNPYYETAKANFYQDLKEHYN